MSDNSLLLIHDGEDWRLDKVISFHIDKFARVHWRGLTKSTILGMRLACDRQFFNRYPVAALIRLLEATKRSRYELRTEGEIKEFFAAFGDINENNQNLPYRIRDPFD